MDERLLTVKETASLTGSSEPQIRRMISQGDLPHVRLSPRGLRIPAEALRAYIADRTVALQRVTTTPANTTTKGGPDDRP